MGFGKLQRQGSFGSQQHGTHGHGGNWPNVVDARIFCRMCISLQSGPLSQAMRNVLLAVEMPRLLLVAFGF
jgi:hypothetical protein